MARVDISGVSEELAGAFAKLRGFQALRDRKNEADVSALPDEDDVPAQWRWLARNSERVLLCPAHRGRLHRGQCLDVHVRWAQPGGRRASATWKAVVLVRRHRTAVLCADPTVDERAQPALPPRSVAVETLDIRAAKPPRCMDDEVERLKRLTQPGAPAEASRGHALRHAQRAVDYDVDDGFDLHCTGCRGSTRGAPPRPRRCARLSPARGRSAPGGCAAPPGPARHARSVKTPNSQKGP